MRTVFSCWSIFLSSADGHSREFHLILCVTGITSHFPCLQELHASIYFRTQCPALLCMINKIWDYHLTWVLLGLYWDGEALESCSYSPVVTWQVTCVKKKWVFNEMNAIILATVLCDRSLLWFVCAAGNLSKSSCSCLFKWLSTLDLRHKEDDSDWKDLGFLHCFCLRKVFTFISSWYKAQTTPSLPCAFLDSPLKE